MITKERLNEYYQTIGHCLFGPSSLKQYINCPASAAQTLNNPDDTTSEWAAAGTMLHEVVEETLPQALGDPNVTREMLLAQYPDLEDNQKGWVEDCWDYFFKIYNKRRKEYCGEIIRVDLEGEVGLGEFDLPEIQGTADVIIRTSETIDVIDWKFGSGVPVTVPENIQACCYLLGAARNFHELDKTTTAHIVQPPLGYAEGWEMSNDFAISLISKLQDLVDTCMAPDPEYGPSMDTCRFCNVKDWCKPRMKHLEQSRRELVKAAAEPPMAIDDRYMRLLDAADDIQQAIKDVRIYAEKVLKSGQKFGYYKMVAGRGSRKFLDVDEAKAAMVSAKVDPYVKPKLKSPAQAESACRALKKDTHFQDLIEKIPGKPILVKGTDKRKALVFGSKSAFAKYIK